MLDIDLAAPADLHEVMAPSIGPRRVGGPVSVAWREGTLTRVKELESLLDWVLVNGPRANCQPLAAAVSCHLEAAREAAVAARLRPRKRGTLQRFRNGPLIERARSNLDAAEAELLNFALARLRARPNAESAQARAVSSRCRLTRDVKSSSALRGAWRRRIRITRSLANERARTRREAEESSCEERGKIVTAVRGASSAALREQLRLRSFRNVVVVTTLLMTCSRSAWRSRASSAPR